MKRLYTLLTSIITAFLLGSFPDRALHIEFLHRKNESNDPYYDYSTNIFSIGTKAKF